MDLGSEGAEIAGVGGRVAGRPVANLDIEVSLSVIFLRGVLT